MNETELSKPVVLRVRAVRTGEELELIIKRIENGWYYPFGLGYNSLIDWTGHPGERKR
ncbi:hypothetical protein PBI_CJW1_45 [Mycobacterium phage Cjw1]|uniref:Uncharacterized protein n=4 Tax=Caudoviricetes TaxID=2731619 RepID=Q857W6_9CAUD|nr:gp45 [Mycobacterium phage Cjw1]YP_008051525.1 hypothetical protein PBI_MURPHY_46 [Mycobacterium phage Murphy]YP_009011806.1 hypothetical protein LILAC_47 [Mycobacterium phage Lilac]YP_009613668.1 hypothetical protein FDI54_gp046 [Mycobacterium phage Pumpkin]AEL21895.1 hypothetical protein ELPH10_44 [Mycobacterium phage Elph10]AKU42484.1 hypothetical protein SEA_NOSLEEP_46 [Mycobacterium phage NoSleep]AQP30764.1 hypothetical protein SEA_MAXXINISTA_46 [Mycobacterium phage Maxxinista]AVO2353